MKYISFFHPFKAIKLEYWLAAYLKLNCGLLLNRTDMLLLVNSLEHLLLLWRGFSSITLLVVRTLGVS